MKKQAFIQELKNALSQADPQVREEIIADISEHFTEGISQGLSEEEICRNLGQPGTIAAQVLEDYAVVQQKPPFQSTSQEQTDDEPLAEGVNRLAGGGYEIDIDKTFVNVNSICAELSESNLRFVPAQGGSFRVTLKGRSRQNEFTIVELNGVLTVKAKSSAWKFSWFRFKSNLETTIYIPSQFMGDIRAKTSAGNISATDTSGQLDLKASAGNITIGGHRATKAHIRTSAGNANIQLASRLIEDLDVSSSAGNVELTAQETGRVKLSTSAGNARANIARLGGDTSISSSAGSVDLTVREIAGDVKIKSSAGSVQVRMPADANCRIETKVPRYAGTVHNEITGNPQSPYLLRATCSAGTVRLTAM